MGWLNSLYGEEAKEHRNRAEQQKQAEAEELRKNFRKDGKPKFDRVSYMRKYMRDLRAKSKNEAK